MSCSWNSQLSAYHDGELDASHRSDVEQHVATCAECSAYLAELRGLSGLFAAEPVARLSQIGVHRLHRRLQAVTEQGILRLARTMSAVAACVVLAGSLWLTQLHETPQAAPPWTGIPSNVDEVAMTDSASPVAQYYLTDLSQPVGEQP
jgi:anti-sigma factor RsiW